MTDFKLLILELEPQKSMEEILEIFDDDIYYSHKSFFEHGDISYFNQTINWMIEDVNTAELPKKLQIVSSLFRYLTVYKKIIFDRKDLLSITKKKALEFLRYYNIDLYTIYEKIHDEMTNVLYNFLSEIKELEEEELVEEKRKNYEEFCKIFNIDPDYDIKCFYRNPPSS